MDEWLLSLSGDWGPLLLDFYLKNSAWISTVVVVYGAFLLLSWWNLRRMRDHLRDEVQGQLDKRPGKVDKESLRVPWNEALGLSRFPFIAAEWGFLPRRVSLDNLQALVSLDDLLPRPERPLPGVRRDNKRSTKSR